MITKEFKFKIDGKDSKTCTRKAKALAGLGSQFDARTLEAINKNGPEFFNHPVFGSMIREKLGL